MKRSKKIRRFYFYTACIKLLARGSRLRITPEELDVVMDAFEKNADVDKYVFCHDERVNPWEVWLESSPFYKIE